MKDEYYFDFTDEPTEEDCLDFSKSVQTVVKQIDKSNLPIILGLFGRWGAGKSTFLKLLSRALQSGQYERKYFPVMFEPWKLENSTSIIYDLISTIQINANKIKATSDRSGNIEKKLFMYLENIGIQSFRKLLFSGISSVADSKFALGKPIYELFSKLFRPSPSKIAANRISSVTLIDDIYKKYLSSLNSIPVVLVDDLDRCKPDTVVSLFEGLKLFLQASESKVIYILAMDHEMIIKAICNRYNFKDWWDGWHYLSKICNVTWFIPRPNIKPLLNFIKNKLIREEDQLALFWNLLESESIENLLYKCDLYLPRRLKRIVQHTHMALSSKSVDLVSYIKKTLRNNQSLLLSTPATIGIFESACYRVLLGLFMLREAYPEVYSQIIYKVNERRAELLIEISKAASNFKNLKERKIAVMRLATDWGLSILHPYLSDHVFLDLVEKLFKCEDLTLKFPNELREEYEKILITEILNPVLGVLMSS